MAACVCLYLHTAASNAMTVQRHLDRTKKTKADAGGLCGTWDTKKEPTEEGGEREKSFVSVFATQGWKAPCGLLLWVHAGSQAPRAGASASELAFSRFTFLSSQTGAGSNACRELFDTFTMPGERLRVGTEALSRIKYVVNHAGISKIRAVQRGSSGGLQSLG